ncbi:iron complex transport system ATP-binding protein [Paenibacillus sp. UNCCL117]|nr:iron complex transport system ATP-binding protein [Paenibacillus sp. cl123]SFW54932.1 iron complex transport system ATP-binding protein [Paenibacillus sp. UNCCL117]
MKPTHTFQAEQIVAGYDHKTVVQGISLVIPSNQVSVIIGANACGKSTLR